MPSLSAQMAAILGEGLLQIDASVLGRQHQLHTSGLQQAAVGGVRNGLLLHRSVHDHTCQFLCFDQLEFDGHVDGLRQQSSTPSSPSSWRSLTSVVASQGRRSS